MTSDPRAGAAQAGGAQVVAPQVVAARAGGAAQAGDLVDRLRDGRTLLVSPHPDDIAYSVGGLLALAGPLPRATLLTVFTRSAWALPRRLRKAGPQVVGARRRTEELRYCRLRGLADYSPLGLDDASLRGYDDVGELTADPAADPVGPALTAALAPALRDTAADTVLAPAAVGGHVDHLLVHRAVRAAGLPSATVLWYEDLPYAGQHPAPQVRRTLAEERGLTLRHTVEISGVLAHKVRGMYVYGSQTDDECVRQALGHARRCAADGNSAVERLWALPEEADQ
ncbi:PIG-L deacetylase family protein [Kitasatospora purpeofusca]|uniref:PIG-L deacetylase family protein n=1 Tax=Kitasatospora purpeofusca TaxID=67352 RepID=UPI00380B4AFC